MAPSNVVAAKPAKPIDIIRAELNGPKMREQLSMALPAHVNIDRFNRVAITAISQNPSLLDADRRSLFASCMTAAQLGLVTDGVLGEAYLVPYKGKVQLIPGYRGLLKLVRQSGEISSVDVDTIHENDKVTLIAGDESRFSIETDWRDRGEVIGAYAIAHFKDGGRQRAIMTLEQIEAIRKAAPSANSPAWKNHYGEMAKKTAFRRLAKMLPLSTEAQNALGVEDAHDAGRTARIEAGALIEDQSEEAASPPAAGRASRLDRLAAEASEVDEDGVVQDAGALDGDGASEADPQPDDVI